MIRIVQTLVVATVLVVHGSASAQSGDAPPSTPEEFAATAYSGTAGAVRWQRSTDDAGYVPGYEVARDGRVLGTFDALSYVDDSLSPGTAYRYTVTAIDTAGQRSGSAAVTLRTQGQGPNSGNGDVAPASPEGLRVDIYSRFNRELFWDRPDTFGLRYEVRRDGEVVANTDGVSYYDDTLAVGETYTYEVVAIDRTGRRSSPARLFVPTQGPGDVTLPPPPSDALPPLVESRLRTAFAIAGGDPVEKALGVARRLRDVDVGPREGFERVRSATNENGVSSTTLRCPAGGKIDIVRDVGNRGEGNGVFFLRRCDVGEVLLDGEISAPASGPDGDVAPASDPVPRIIYELTITDRRDGTEEAIGVARVEFRLAFADEVWARTVSVFNSPDSAASFRSTGGARPYSLASSLRIASPPEGTEPAQHGFYFDTNFEALVGEGETAETLVVRQVGNFGGIGPNGEFTRGLLRVAGKNREFNYEVDADSGDPATFRLDVEENGSVASYLVPWSEGLDIETLRLSSAYDPGF